VVGDTNGVTGGWAPPAILARSSSCRLLVSSFLAMACLSRASASASCTLNFSFVRVGGGARGVTCGVVAFINSGSSRIFLGLLGNSRSSSDFKGEIGSGIFNPIQLSTLSSLSGPPRCMSGDEFLQGDCPRDPVADAGSCLLLCVPLGDLDRLGLLSFRVWEWRRRAVEASWMEGASGILCGDRRSDVGGKIDMRRCSATGVVERRRGRYVPAGRSGEGHRY
jgi:hypothetical protein